MTEIERRWFGDQTSCPNQGSTLSSDTDRLDFKSFWGLFLITGAVSMLCCIVFLSRSAYRNRRTFKDIAAEKSFSRRLISIARLFNAKDSSSHGTRRRTEPKQVGPATRDASPSASPYSNDADDQTTISDHTFDGGSPLPEIGSPITDPRPHAEITEASR